MPIYEYRCRACGRRSSVLLRGFAQPQPATCPLCGSGPLVRLVSRFAVVRSEESHLDDLADSASFADVDENDPRSMGRWARKLGKEMGEDLGPEFDEVVDQLESGQMPEEPEGDDGDTEEALG